jgi:chromosome segregation ATPase
MEANKTQGLAAERKLPLLRSIGRELNERASAIHELETRLEAFGATRRAREGEIAQIESQLSTQRRELRNLEQELAALDCGLELRHLMLPHGDRPFGWPVHGSLDDTRFYEREQVDIGA